MGLVNGLSFLRPLSQSKMEKKGKKRIVKISFYFHLIQSLFDPRKEEKGGEKIGVIVLLVYPPPIFYFVIFLSFIPSISFLTSYLIQTK